MQKIQAKLRRESISTATQDQPTDFWLLFANQHESRISDKDMVKALDDIFEKYDGKNRDGELVKYLAGQKLLDKDTLLKSYWLEPVEDALSAPIKIFLNPSGKCPNHCKTCSILMSRSQTLDDEIAREVMKQVVELPVFWLTMVGGEPVDYPLFFEFAEQAINHGINVSTTVSGVGLTKAWAEKAKDLGIRLKVSLDGPKKVNDVQRPGTYESAIKAVRLFKEIDYPVMINMVHTKLNNDEKVINEMFKIAQANGAKGIELSRLRPLGGAMCNEIMIPYEDFKNGKVERVLNAYTTHPFIEKHGLEIYCDSQLFPLDSPSNRWPHKVWGVDCSAGKTNMGINMDGQVDSCYYLPHKYLPKVNVNSLKDNPNPNFLLDTWRQDETLKKLRQFTRSSVKCPACEKKHKMNVSICPAMTCYYNQPDPAVFLH